LKLDTGMHRLGFQVNNLMPLIEVILSDSRLRVVSVLSHLAASDNPEFDDFTRAQLRMFNDMCTQLRERLGHGFTQHIANTSGVRRFPEAHYDMVRLGIGLYGIASDDKEKAHLHPVATFKTTVSQLRIIEAGESVGYNRSFMAERTSTIATIPVGYADGLMRTLSNGKGRAKINGQWAPYVGRVCMDMTMLDVTGLAVQEGDEVILFGDSPSIEEIATSAGTIPYEIIAGISQRVKRIFIRD
jgi:alanine racemase